MINNQEDTVAPFDTVIQDKDLKKYNNYKLIKKFLIVIFLVDRKSYIIIPIMVNSVWKMYNTVSE